MNLFQAWAFAAIDSTLSFIYVFFEVAIIKLGLKNSLGLSAIKTKKLIINLDCIQDHLTFNKT